MIRFFTSLNFHFCSCSKELEDRQYILKIKWCFLSERGGNSLTCFSFAFFFTWKWVKNKWNYFEKHTEFSNEGLSIYVCNLSRSADIELPSKLKDSYNIRSLNAAMLTHSKQENAEKWKLRLPVNSLQSGLIEWYNWHRLTGHANEESSWVT